jgi:hypothetical protein
MGKDSMNIVTIKAKAQLAGVEIDKRLGGEENVYWIKSAPKVYANIIEDVFIPPVLNKEPLYSMCAFSGVTGIGIYNKQNRCVAVIPPQLPTELNFTEKSMRESTIDHIKLQTERVARIILDKLNEA